MTKTKLGHVLLLRLQCLHHVRHVDADTTANFGDHFTAAHFDIALLLDRLKEFGIQNADRLSLGQV